jgi:hypothetical protein
MSYSTEIATVLAKQLAKLATLNRHQIVGQLANVDFWLDEVRHALGVLDGYEPRFERMKVAQTQYVSEHKTTVFFPDEPDLQSHAPPPRRVPSSELQEARRSLCDATYRFLVRCHNEKFIEETTLRRYCDELVIGIEASDLKRR